MKRSILILVIALLCTLSLLCLIACGNKDASPAGDADSEQTPGSNDPSHTHAYGGWKTTTPATCGKEGVETRSCSCGASESRSVAATGDHTYGSWTVVTPATCAEGVEQHSCDCGANETRPIAAVQSHSFTEKSVTEAYAQKASTCQSGGVYYYKCAGCTDKGTTTYEASKLAHSMDENHICTMCNNGYIYFGEYPQSLKADDVTVTDTKDSRGYYLGSDNAYYAKVTGNPYSSSGYAFANDETVVMGTAYYFKVEPILWRILAQDDGTAMILCDSIIVGKTYHSGGFNNDSNEYGSSGIRSWLNNQFYQNTFSELERELILTTTVDNSVASTGYTSNRYAGADTSDKIFLLSYVEVTNTEYGFSDGTQVDESREMQVSDYSRATGVWMNTTRSDNNYGNGYWWLRSPYYNDKEIVRQIGNDGKLTMGDAGRNGAGVVPAMWIRLP